jgi:hypothetical protein
MQPRAFERSLRELSNRVPFQRFNVEFVSGSRITVDHPEALVFRGGLAVYVAPDGTPSLFDHESVARLSRLNGKRVRR